MEIEVIKRINGNVRKFLQEVDKSFLPVKTASTSQYSKCDIVIITASIDEYHSFSKHIEGTEIKEYSNDPLLYLKGFITAKSGKALSVIMPIPGEMGIASASINTAKAIINFSPTYVYMVGICAGIKTITSIGDIIIAEKTIDYNEVVEIENSDSTVRTKFMNNVISITTNTKSKCHLWVSKFQFNYSLLKENFGLSNELRCHFGLLATGSALLRNSERVRQLAKDYHNVKGIDMETYGVYKAVDSFENRSGEIHFLSIKAVSDYADNDKVKGTEAQVDKRGIALHNSSLFLHGLILNS
jgi:nucleoside phosphorylase